MTFYCFFVVDTNSIGCSQKKRAFPEFEGGWVDIDLAVSSPQVACSQNKRLHKSPFSIFFVHNLQIFQLAAAYSLIYIYTHTHIASSVTFSSSKPWGLIQIQDSHLFSWSSSSLLLASSQVAATSI